jgi:hypothetical protein
MTFELLGFGRAIKERQAGWVGWMFRAPCVGWQLKPSSRPDKGRAKLVE